MKEAYAWKGYAMKVMPANLFCLTHNGTTTPSRKNGRSNRSCYACFHVPAWPLQKCFVTRHTCKNKNSENAHRAHMLCLSMHNRKCNNERVPCAVPPPTGWRRGMFQDAWERGKRKGRGSWREEEGLRQRGISSIRYMRAGEETIHRYRHECSSRHSVQGGDRIEAGNVPTWPVTTVCSYTATHPPTPCKGKAKSTCACCKNGSHVSSSPVLLHDMEW